MCGIIGYISKNKEISIRSLIQSAHYNKHRGEEDGVGFIYLDPENKKIKIVKTLLFLDELVNDTISKDKRKVKENTEEKNKEIIKLFEKRLEEFQKILDFKTNMCIIHHRKASHGEIKLKNTHPFNITKGIFYMHNGTLYDFESLGNYLSLNNNIKLKSDTDSEVLANICEEYLSSWRYDNSLFDESLYAYLQDIFLYWGVLIRFDTNKKRVDIITSGDRSLYVYAINNETSHFFISEPIITNELKYDNCYKIIEGTITIDLNKMETFLDKSYFLDITNKLKDISKLLKISKVIKLEDTKCQTCDNKKFSCLKGIWLKSKKEKISYRQDICISCLIEGNMANDKKIEPKYSYFSDRDNIEIGETKKENLDDKIQFNNYPLVQSIKLPNECEICSKRFYGTGYGCFTCPVYLNAKDKSSWFNHDNFN